MWCDMSSDSLWDVYNKTFFTELSTIKWGDGRNSGTEARGGKHTTQYLYWRNNHIHNLWNYSGRSYGFSQQITPSPIHCHQRYYKYIYFGPQLCPQHRFSLLAFFLCFHQESKSNLGPVFFPNLELESRKKLEGVDFKTTSCSSRMPSQIGLDVNGSLNLNGVAFQPSSA